MDAVNDGRVKFFPERYAKTYLDWLGEKRDWCISRQLWWGHRIPDLVRARCPRSRAEERHLRRIASDVTWRLDEDNGQMAAICCAWKRSCPTRRYWVTEILGLEQDPDVLDTWFSSALWPHSTLGWPEQTRRSWRYYYPTSVLVTSRDIITLWVARMVMTGLYNVGKVPFHHVYIHPKILDGFGETMSKSKGNGIDPLDIIERYGTDALRFVMVHLATETQDSRMPVANVCPHCDTLVPVKQEHMYMRTRKVTCPELQEAVPSRRSVAGARPGAADGEAGVGALRDRPQLRQQALERRPLPAAEPGRLHAGAAPAGGAADRGPLDSEPAGDDHGGGDASSWRATASARRRGRFTTSPGRSSATGTWR